MSSVKGKYGRVTFKFEASVEEELSLEIGNVLNIIDIVDDFWYVGKNLQTGLKGQFPKDFVDILKLPTTKGNETLLFALDSFYPEVNDDLPFKRGDIIVLEKKVDDSWGKGCCQNKHGIFPLNYTQHLMPIEQQLSPAMDENKILYSAVAIMPVTAQLDNELSLIVGDVVSVTEIVDEVWAKGIVGNTAGIFPITFTEPLHKSSASLDHKTNSVPLNSSSNFSVSADTRIASRDKSAIGPDYKSGSHLKALNTISSFIENNVNSLSMQSKNQYQLPNSSERVAKPIDGTSLVNSVNEKGSNSLNIDNKRFSKDTVVAAYSYNARNKNELSFTKGDEIEVVQRSSEMWLYGKLQNNYGYVPRIYVSEHMYSAAEKYNHEPNCLTKSESSSNSNINEDVKLKTDVRRVSEHFKAVTEFDITVKQGELVTLLKTLNEEWCEVKNGAGKTGFVPLKCISELAVGLTKSQSSSELIQHASNKSTGFSTDTYRVRRNTSVNPKFLSGFQSDGFAASKFKTNTNDSGFSSSESGESRNSIHENAAETKTAAVRISRQQPVSRFSKKSSYSDITPLKEKSHILKDNKIKETINETPLESTNKSYVANRRYSETKAHKKVDSLGRSKSLYSKGNAHTSKNTNFSSQINPDSFELPSSTGFDSKSNGRSDTISTCSSNSSRSTNHSTDSNRQVNNKPQAKQSSRNPDADLLFHFDFSEDRPPDVPMRTSSNRRTTLRAAPPPPSKAPAQSLPSPPAKATSKAPNRPPQPTNIKPQSKMTSSEHKLKIEKVRSEIEEYCRMKKELESLYQGSFDGKERQDISENKQFVLAKLKRLQKELADLIDVAGNVYESLDEYSKPEENENLLAPPLPTPTPTAGPEEIKQQRRIKRGHVIQEILNTEKDFNLDIEITIEDIQTPLVDQLPMEMKTDILFGNLTEVRDFSAALLSHLKATCNESTPEDEWNIGKVFVDLVPRMTEVYKVYCCNHDDATALLEKYEDDPEFMEPVQECLRCVRTKTNTFDLGSFLIKPVQRILKYPLLLNELLKLTDQPTPGSSSVIFKDLLVAVKEMHGVANIINENKRRKDLVRKYRKGSRKGSQVSRINFHSVKKKSQRISQRFGHVTGLNQPETVDEKFNDLERRFKEIEHSIKSFIVNINKFGTECHSTLGKELLLSENFSDFFSSDITKVMTLYNRTIRKVTDQLYRQFHDQVVMRVVTPLSALLVKFKGPQAVIDKRFDKLLDYEKSQGSTDAKDKILMAKNIYEALNQQLVDELPRLCKLSLVLLRTSCAIFLELFIKFQQKMLKEFSEIQEVLKTEEKLKDNVELSKSGIIEAFSSLHFAVLSDISRYNFIPSALIALSPSRGQTRNSVRRSSFNRHEAHIQTPQQREDILKKYSEYDLFVANEAYVSTDKMYVSCSKNDLIGVIKRQSPMGDNNVWFVDNGESSGFISCGILCLYKVESLYHDATYAQTSSPSTPSFTYGAQPQTRANIPSPKPRQRVTPRQTQNQPSVSPNQSPGTSPQHPLPPNQSSGSPNRSSLSRSPSSKLSTSPYSMRQSISGRLASPPPEFFGDGIMNDVLDDEDEMMSDKEYGEVGKAHQKKCFRIEYDFEARSELELSVHCREIVTLLIPHDLEGNPEWWLMAASNGLQGYVPANYVSPVEVEYL